MQPKASARRSPMTRLSSLYLLPGLLALTACATPPAPMPVALDLRVPPSLSDACGRPERPSLPLPGSLDTSKPTPTQSGLYSEADMKRVWDALVARGLWIVRQAEFSVQQEGALAQCDGRRAAAVDILNAASAASGG